MITAIDDIDHPALIPYRNMRNQNWIEPSGIFVAEGPMLVELLLESDYEMHSLLLDEKYLDRYSYMVSDEFECYAVEHSLVEQLVGFKFHRGVIACGKRKPVLGQLQGWTYSDSLTTMVALFGVQDQANVGGILRNCAAFGVEHVIIGPGTADPLVRRALRVSMANTLRLKIHRSVDVLQDLELLHRNGVTTIATSLQEGSLPLEHATRSGPTLIMFGNEKRGLSEEIQRFATHRVRVDMDLGTDSLNASVAAGVIIHYFTRIATGCR